MGRTPGLPFGARWRDALAKCGRLDQKVGVFSSEGRYGPVMILATARHLPVWIVLTIAMIGVAIFAMMPLLPKAQDRLANHLPAEQGFVGSGACRGCHATQFEAWSGSHHAHAMFAIDRPGAVLGDFGNATASAGGSSARFFREQGRYLVETSDKAGQPARFTLSHTFGWTPLQQYLVTLPDGRIQVLPWAWDSRPAGEGGQRWFAIYGDESIGPADPRHWLGLQQNANHMCIECHVTGYEKGYRAKVDRFETRWRETGAGCESCHGPAAGHLGWAARGAPGEEPLKGFPAGQPRVSPLPAASGRTGLMGPPGPSAEVETCARCHSRRSQIEAGWQPGQPFLDGHRPVLLAPDLFEHDGQMKDEVFNDHSFRQSLMFQKGVTCGHCHDPHAGKLRAGRAEICGQCHEPARFSVPAHTGHVTGPGSPDCVACHMPARTYMQIDRRHDHSFRIPRPDQTARLGTPNTCQACHADKPATWAAAALERLHGPPRKGFQAFGEAFHDSRAGDPVARLVLQALAIDPAQPASARATALAELGNWPALGTARVLAIALADSDPLVRATAIREHQSLPMEIRRQRLLPSLADPIRVVRIAAATALADLSPDTLAPPDAGRLMAALREAEAAETAHLDRPEARMALALLFLKRGRIADAEAEYRAAWRLDPGSAATAINLADLLRRTGRETEAGSILRAALARDPDTAAARYALGLSLLRSGKPSDALAEFRIAAEHRQPQARHLYAYALALQSAGQPDQAREILRKGSGLFPGDLDLAGALFQDAIRRGDNEAARALAARLARLRPDDPGIRQLEQRLSRP